jgi:dephospho-CoA kinase
MPHRIGITGGIGAGKSTVCKVFESLQVPVYYADTRGREITNTNTHIKEAISRLFGKNVYDQEGKLNRNKVSDIVFGDRDALAQLNTIVHPEVIKDYHQWLGRQKAPYVLMESAILFESGLFEEMDVIVCVYAPDELRISRIIKRDNISREKVLEIMHRQMPEILKMEKSDFLIFDDEKHSVLEQVLLLNEVFRISEE